MKGLLWIQVSFECYDGVRIPYMEKTCWCLYGEIDLRNVAGMGGRVILAGKSQKQKTILWHRL